MIKRNLALMAAATYFCMASYAIGQTTATRPNILWITVEDMSPDLPMYGDDTAHTPRLEKLAAEGRTYTRAFAPSPVCSTSRSSIITGMYNTTIGAHHHRSSVELPDKVHCFTEHLRAAGYYCTNNVKTDYNFPMPENAWDESSKRAHWRNRSDPSQPFFSVFNFTTTHESKFMLDDDKFEEVIKDVPADRRVTTETVKLPPYIPDTPVTRADWARMYNTISQMDIEVGAILDELAADGYATNTIVMYYSDHGRGLPRGKRWLYDSGLQVPLIVRWPGHVEAGTKDEPLVSLLDMAPTVLSLAGVEVPDVMQGRIFMGDQKQSAPECLFFTRDRMDETHDMSRAVRDDRYKYIKNFYPERPYDQPINYLERNPTMQEMRRLDKAGKLSGPQALYFQGKKPAEEFYDTQADPHEINNLADDPQHAERLKKMRIALEQWQKTTGDKGLEPEPKSQVR
jgi:uncharacterized sulfatase